MIEKAFDRNKDGGGAAWRTKNAKGENVVEWKKGLDVKGMIELAETLPLPYVLHFRVATIGGVRPELTHPFPIHTTAPLALTGQTTGHVLFHNGSWKEWDAGCRQVVGAKDRDGRTIQAPLGPWSDSRAIAWLCSIVSHGFMGFFPTQKGILLGPEDMEIYEGNGWSKINDVYCSNDLFMTQTSHVQQGWVQTQGQTPTQTQTRPGRGAGLDGRFCKFGACTNQTLDDDGYCFVHPRGIHRLIAKTATGGSRVPPSPFVHTRQVQLKTKTQTQTQTLPIEIPLGEVVSIELAEFLCKQNQLSKNKVKKIRGLWEKATGPGKKSARRAEQALRQLSVTIINGTRLTGSGH